MRPLQVISGMLWCGLVCAASAVPLLIVGPRSHTSLAVWIHSGCANDECTLPVAVAHTLTGRPVISGTIRTVKSDDHVGVVEVSDLLSSTQYTITVGTGSSAVSGSYRTLPRPASYLSPAGSSAGVNTGGAVLTSFKMAHSSCAHDKGNDLAEIAHSGSDLLLLLGDQMYTDLAKNDSASFQADLRHPKFRSNSSVTPENLRQFIVSKYLENFGDTYYQTLFRSLPVLMTWDDHELKNDYHDGPHTDLYRTARAVFDEFQGSHNPKPLRKGALYFTLQAGPVEMFVLDTRSFRVDHQLPDGPHKTMLGAPQKADLLQWLSSSQAPVKVIASSVMWSDQAAASVTDTGDSFLDCWFYYAREREDIFRHIVTHQIHGVVLLSADAHWSGAFQHPRSYLVPRTAAADSMPSDAAAASPSGQWMNMSYTFYELSASPLMQYGLPPALQIPLRKLTLLPSEYRSTGLFSYGPAGMKSTEVLSVYGLLSATSSGSGCTAGAVNSATGSACTTWSTELTLTLRRVGQASPLWQQSLSPNELRVRADVLNQSALSASLLSSSSPSQGWTYGMAIAVTAVVTGVISMTFKPTSYARS